MSSQEINRLKINNEKLLKTNKQLNDMLKLMDRFRVLLISMVNNCKCNTETNIRIKFNLLMEEYYEMSDSKSSINQSFNNKINDIFIDNKLNETQIEDNCNQIDVNSVVDNLLIDQTLLSTEDNVIFV